MVASFVPALLFGLAANVDNLTVGMAYGVKRRWISPAQNLLIAAGTTGITLLALAAGWRVRDALAPGLAETAGGVLLIALAAWGYWRERAGSTVFAVAETGSRLLLGECFFLAGALSINNIGLAIGEGLGGVFYVPATVSVFGFSVAMLALGQAIGQRVARWGRVHRLLRSPAMGNIVLALAGGLMLAGF